MPSVPPTSLPLSSISRGVTTLLCCGWGYSFAYSFFQCILENSSPMVLLAAALPLLAVWAALERKRWGRLALIGLSLLAPGLFALMLIALAYSNEVWIRPSDRHLFGYIDTALRLFSDSPSTTIGVLVLAAATAIWLCIPIVRDEYIKKKKPFLTPGQRVIAASIISIWGITMIATPTTVENRTPNIPLKAQRRLTLRY